MPPRSFPLLKYLDKYAESESTGEIRAEGKTLKKSTYSTENTCQGGLGNALRWGREKHFLGKRTTAHAKAWRQDALESRLG